MIVSVYLSDADIVNYVHDETIMPPQQSEPPRLTDAIR